jgi:hypothetical protein
MQSFFWCPLEIQDDCHYRTCLNIWSCREKCVKNLLRNKIKWLKTICTCTIMEWSFIICLWQSEISKINIGPIGISVLIFFGVKLGFLIGTETLYFRVYHHIYENIIGKMLWFPTSLYVKWNLFNKKQLFVWNKQMFGLHSLN